MLSVQAQAVGRHQQGAVVGLRQTGQRLTSIMIPPLMGGIADRWGVNESFFILGALMMLLCVPLALIIRRIGRFRSARKERFAGYATSSPSLAPHADRAQAGDHRPA
jgi:hypothetical protein